MRTCFLPLALCAGLLAIMGCRWSASFDADRGLLLDVRTDASPGTLVGLVLRGPVRPVTLEGEEDTAPLADAPIEVRDESGAVAAIAMSGQDGTFRLALAPGNYTLVARPLSTGRWPKPPVAQQLKVRPHLVARVRLEYDTGVRYKYEGGK